MVWIWKCEEVPGESGDKSYLEVLKWHSHTESLCHVRKGSYRAAFVVNFFNVYSSLKLMTSILVLIFCEFIFVIAAAFMAQSDT